MKEVLAILVLYKCKLEDSETFNSLALSLKRAGETLDILIYDNSPVRQYSQSKFCRGNFYVHYISDTSNPGVSKAYNTGAALAKEKNKKWLLLLDQDTYFSVDYIDLLKEGFNHNVNLIVPSLLNADKKLISPCKFILGRAVGLRKIESGIQSIKQRNFLNSSSCIYLDLFEKAGKYDEQIPLYYSDFDFFLRLSRYTTTYYLLATSCFHDMASADCSDINKFEYRFRIYCLGALKFGNKFSLKLLMAFYVISRGIKITVKTKDKRFLVLPFKIINESCSR